MNKKRKTRRLRDRQAEASRGTALCLLYLYLSVCSLCITETLISLFKTSRL